MKKNTVIIVDDHKLIRESWSLVLSMNPSFHVIAECSSGEEAIEKMKNLHPDIIIMDINLPGINGQQATTEILKLSPGSKILAVSMHTQPTYARQMMQRGAVGYVTKGSSKEELFHALKEISEGRKYICKEIKDVLAEQELHNNERSGYGIKLLSRRELEIIPFIRKGFSSKQIAQTLNISVKTIEVHRYNILKKLKLKNTAALVNYMNSNYPDLW